MRGRASIRLEQTDLSVQVPYRDDKSRDQEMPIRVNDEKTGLMLSLGQEVMVRTRGVNWERKSIDAEIVRG